MASKEDDAAATKMQATMRAKNARAPNPNYTLDASLKAEAERIFALADKTGNKVLDLGEVRSVALTTDLPSTPLTVCALLLSSPFRSSRRCGTTRQWRGRS